MDLLVYKLALIGFLGMLAQWLAWRLNLPAIVLMSLAGLAAGPMLGLIQPEQDFGEFLRPVISVAVAIILFEGGLSLKFSEIIGLERAVRRLVFPGALIAWLSAGAAAYYLAGLSLPVAILFGGLLVVTGPTVIMPLLRQAKLKRHPAAVLRWEGIVNDPVGAMLAVVTFEVIRETGAGEPLAQVILYVALASIAAGFLGFGAGRGLAFLFRRGLVAEFLKAPFILVSVIGVFALANLIEKEAGLVAVTVMGMALANSDLASYHEIRRFKENIAVLLISGVFVILTATLTVEDILSMGWRDAAFVAALLFIVRPLTVWLSTIRAGLSWQERLLIGWIAPRGIVAVTVAGFFATSLVDLGIEDGARLVPLAFAVVFATVLAHGFSISPMARMLGLVATSRPGALIVGASPWTTALGKLLHDLKVPVLLADSNWNHLRAPRLSGLPTYFGEVLSEASEHSVNLSQFGALVAATDNDAYNALVCSNLAPEIGRARVYQTGPLQGNGGEESRSLAITVRGAYLFEAEHGIDELNRRLALGWTFNKTTLTREFSLQSLADTLPNDAFIVCVIKANGEPVFAAKDKQIKPVAGEVVVSFSPPDGLPD